MIAWLNRFGTIQKFAELLGVTSVTPKFSNRREPCDFSKISFKIGSLMKENDIIPAVNKILRQHLGSVYKLYLFGSRALNRHTENSDFDLLVDAGKKIEFGVFAKIRYEIEELPTLYSVDLTDWQAADPEFLKTIEEDLVDVSTSG